MIKLVLLPALVAALPALAALPPLPNTQVDGTVFFNLGPSLNTNMLGPIRVDNPLWGTAQLNIAGQPSSAVSAFAEMANSNFSPLYARSVGTLGFFFAIDGPTAQVDVNIAVAGSASAFASSGASFVVRSTWELWDSGNQINRLAFDEISTPQMSGTFSQSFGRTLTLQLDTGHVYYVRLVANAEAAATNPGTTASASAFVDPVFSIGGNANPALYTFGLSAGVGNQPVPEPPAMAMLALGLVALAWRRRAASRG